MGGVALSRQRCRLGSEVLAQGETALRDSQFINIPLPLDLAARVKAKVVSGEYASEDEVIRDGLNALRERDVEVEEWLRGEVRESFDEFAADPGSGVPGEEVMERVRASYGKRAIANKLP
jgi:antitoxin ParD1/3/4